MNLTNLLFGEKPQKSCLDPLNKRIQAESDFAWAWHCNIAMPMQDAGISHKRANDIAANIMSILFEVDVTKSYEWAMTCE